MAKVQYSIEPSKSFPSASLASFINLEHWNNNPNFASNYWEGSKKMERYLFLDIDGVLNTMRYSNYLTDHGEDDTDEDGALFDPEAVANLETIIKNVPDVKIIISSTWRFKGWDWMNRLWEKRHLPEKIYGFTPALEFVRFQDVVSKDYSESVYPYGTRGLEIGEWLRLNKRRNPLVYRYVIIDDEDDFPSEYNDHVILTNPQYGITKETALQVIENLL